MTFSYKFYNYLKKNSFLTVFYQWKEMVIICCIYSVLYFRKNRKTETLIKAEQSCFFRETYTSINNQDAKRQLSVTKLWVRICKVILIV